MSASLVTTIGNMEPKFPQMLKPQDLGPSGVGRHRPVRQAQQKAARRKIQVTGVALAIFSQNAVSRLIGHKPVGLGAADIDGNAIEKHSGPEIYIESHDYPLALIMAVLSLCR